MGRARGRGTSHAPPVAHAQVSLTGSTSPYTKYLMGLYELCDAKAPSGSVMYVNHNAGDDELPKRYLYRASNNGTWWVAKAIAWHCRHAGATGAGLWSARRPR